MTPADHTPGPWRFTESKHPKYKDATQFAIESPSRAAMFLGDVWESKQDQGATDEVRANFQLAAAAPELLDALRLLVGALEGFGVDRHHLKLPEGFIHAVISAGDAGRAAIEKAYGIK